MEFFGIECEGIRRALHLGEEGFALEDTNPFDARDITGFDLDIDRLLGHPGQGRGDPSDLWPLGVGLDDPFEGRFVAEPIKQFKGEFDLPCIAR